MHGLGSAGGRAGEQFPRFATRGQEVTASGLEDGPVGDWLVPVEGGAESGGRGRSVSQRLSDPAREGTELEELGVGCVGLVGRPSLGANRV